MHSEQGKGTEFIINLDFRLSTEPAPNLSEFVRGARLLLTEDNEFGK